MTDATSIDNYSLTAADVIDSVARTDAGRLFTTPAFTVNSFSTAPFNNLQYIAYVRYFLGLPPIQTIGEPTVHLGSTIKCRDACPSINVPLPGRDSMHEVVGAHDPIR